MKIKKVKRSSPKFCQVFGLILVETNKKMSSRVCRNLLGFGLNRGEDQNKSIKSITILLRSFTEYITRALFGSYGPRKSAWARRTP